MRICHKLVLLLSFYLTIGRSYGNYTLLDQVTGSVANTAYRYLSLSRQSSSVIAIVLTSLEGDCDLYLSEQSKTKRPTNSQYDLCSATCGPDYVLAPPSLRYPLYIGVFGYPSSTDCEFQMDILLLDVVVEEEDLPIDFDIEEYVSSISSKVESNHKYDLWDILNVILWFLEVFL